VFFAQSGYTGDVNLLRRSLDGPGDPFAETQWSVILAAGRSQTEPEKAQAALAQLCQTYWRPLYTFVRSRGHAAEDAEDLTQSFFVYLIEHKIYLRADREKGKFRSFLLSCLKNVLADAHDREQALRRGGGRDLLSLNEAQVAEEESLFQARSAAAHAPNEDRQFERRWAETLIAGALERLATHYRDENKKKLFEELKVFLTGTTPLPTYADLAARLEAPESTLRGEVTRLRARYRETLRFEVRRTVDRAADVEDELRELLRVLTTS
jgi:RNA polymerase sigma factor (sigma-70 family)